MTVRHLARYNINYIEYLLSKVKPLRKPFTPIEIKRGVYVIDIPVRKTIIGHVNGKRNVLNYIFWGTIFEMLQNGGSFGATDTCGDSIIMGYLLDVNSSPMSVGTLIYGSSSSSPSFSSTSIPNICGSISPQISIGTLSDRTRITYYGTLPSNINCQINELGICGTDGYGCCVFIAILQQSFSPGTAVAYYIDLLEPWLQNFGLILYSALTRSSVSGVIDTSGNSQTFSSIANSSTLIGSVNQYTWSPTMYSITQDVIFSTSHDVSVSTTYATDYIQGTASPSSNMEIYTLGLLQTLNPVSGSRYQAFILILPLSSPITLYANQQNTVSLRLVAE